MEAIVLESEVGVLWAEINSFMVLMDGTEPNAPGKIRN
jgi:hypothetical protein